MRDRLFVDVMGTPVEIDLANLAASDALRVDAALRPYVRARVEDTAEVVVEASVGEDEDPVVRVAREIGKALQPIRPDLWWLRIAGTLTTAEGGVVLVCGYPAGGGESDSEVDDFAAVDGGLVGIDSEGGTAPVLCLSGDFRWLDESSASPEGLPHGSMSRVVRIVFAERRIDPSGGMEFLSDRAAIERLVPATVGFETLSRPQTLIPSLLDATGGAVQVPSSDPVEFRALLGRTVAGTGARAGEAALHRRFLGAPAAESDLTSPPLHRGRLTDAIDLSAGTREPSWTVGPATVWRSSEDHTLVLSADEAEPPLFLRDSAHRIWQILVDEKACSVRHLAETASIHYGVAAADIQGEIGALVDDFRARGLVSRV